jgi:hypothetical protein
MKPHKSHKKLKSPDNMRDVTEIRSVLRSCNWDKTAGPAEFIEGVRMRWEFVASFGAEFATTDPVIALFC